MSDKIPDDTKIFLRAVLGATPGMPQSSVMKEYFQTTGEQIHFTKFGFGNLFEFLVALEGEVTRIEFSPKHGENLIYSVLDRTKYASKHAEKYANKVGTGMRGKSPDEILLWKKDQKERGRPLPTPSLRKPQQRHRHNRLRKVVISEKQSKEVPPTVSEWLTLRRLLPDAEGNFRLFIRHVGVNQKRGRFDDQALYSHFAAYQVLPRGIRSTIMNSKRVSILPFRTFFNAYRAWKEKDKTIILGHRIGIEPAGGTVNSLPLHKVSAFQIPTGLLMSTFVTQFAKFPGLICIHMRPRENNATISYSTKESAQRACKEINNVTVNGNKVSIVVKELDEKTSMSFGVVNNATEHKISGQSNKQEPVEKPVTPVVSETKDVDSLETFDDRACGFCITYQQAIQMFQTTCRKKPTMSADIPEEIQFIMTHPVDSCRFWGWIMKENSVTKLLDIEKKLAISATKVQPQHVLPKEGQRGTALYKDDENETWYRCYVLSSNTEKDEILVFYCDYGNAETIPRDRFRTTYNDVWALPPQAIPFKIHGFESKFPIDSIEFSQGKDNLSQLVGATPLKATVTKMSTYSQPHIIEVNNLIQASSPISIDDKITSWCVPVEEKSKACNDLQDTEEDLIQFDGEDGIVEEEDGEEPSMLSLFDYDEDELILGLLSEAHNPNLLYLKLGDMSNFAALEIELDGTELRIPSNLEKGDILLYAVKDQRRRVMALQIIASFGKVKVLHVDYGVIGWVSIEDIYQLNKDLQEAPFQSRPASLAGIDCKQTMPQAVEFIKGKSKMVIKANVIRENSNGKITVELFDAQTNKSLNKEMIEKNIAVRVHEVTDTDEELTPNMIPIPVKELVNHVPSVSLLRAPSCLPEPTEIQTIINNIIGMNKLRDTALPAASWNTNPPIPYSQTAFSHQEHFNGLPDHQEQFNGVTDHQEHFNNLHDHQEHFNTLSDHQDHFNDLPDKITDKIPKLLEVNTWIEHSPLKSEVMSDFNQQNADIEATYDDFSREFDEKTNRPAHDASYPPPDIISSNKITNAKIDQGLGIDGREFRIGDDGEIVHVDMNNKLNIDEVREMQQKWISEKETLVEIKEKLERLMNMSSADLNAYYKIMKKEKLQLKIRIKEAKKHASTLEAEHQKIIQETNSILSLI